MYNDNRRSSAFFESGVVDKDKCFPYSILSKQRQVRGPPPQPPQPPPPPAAYRNYPMPALALSRSAARPLSNGHHLSAATESPFYANAMVTDVGICFSMSNVNLNSDFPPYLGHPSLSVLGRGTSNTSPPTTAPPTPLVKYRMGPPPQPQSFKPRTPPMPAPNPLYPVIQPNIPPYPSYYFAHPKIPIKIFNNHTYPFLPDPATSASTASVAAAYGQQLNNYYNSLPAGANHSTPEQVQVPVKRRQNAKQTLLNNQYYDICMTECGNAMEAAMLAPTSTAEPPTKVVAVAEQPQDFSLKGRNAAVVVVTPPPPSLAMTTMTTTALKVVKPEPTLETMDVEVVEQEPDLAEPQPADECRRRTAAPKKKWIRHYLKDEPILNGHSSSTAPPLVVISTSSSSGAGSIGQQLLHQKHHPPALTIDLSTKSSSSHHIVPHHHQQRLSSGTPPSSSSGCSSSSTSSTLTISPVDDSQSSLNLSGGSTTSGYVTSHSANSSSSLNLSGSPPAGHCLSSSSSTSSASSTSSHGSNSSPLPHDLVIVQQHSQQQSPSPLGISQLTSTATLLGHVPTGGRRRTTSSNSNGVGTREVHNKLEKNRRAHLKECFEQLKKQLTLQPDEKKTSNLSILHAAIRHIQVLKRKEREYEHEMERLAKEKIAAQNRILLLKRELSQWGDVDFSRLAPDTDAIPNGGSSTSVASNGTQQADRDLLNDPPGNAPGGRNGMRYSSSSSLSSVATTASIGNLPLQTTISPVLVAASSSPTRASPPSAVTSSRSTSSPSAMPLSLTTKTGQEAQLVQNGTPLKLNGLNGTTNGTAGLNGTTLPLIVGTNNLSALGPSQLFTPVTTILTTGNGSAIQTLPLNLNVAAASANGHLPHHHSTPPNGLITSTATGLQIIGTSSSGINGSGASSVVTNGKELINGTALAGKNGLRTSAADGGNKIEIIATQTTAGSALALEPPATKVIKLVNGNTLVGLTSMDKDKMMLSQVVQPGGIVVSPIQLLTSTQGLRVIQQAPNGLATIELSSPTNVQSQSSQVHRTTGGNGLITTNGTSTVSSAAALSQHLSSSQTVHLHHQPQPPQIQQVTGAQLHKLLLTNGTVNGSSVSSSSNSSNSATTVVSTTSITPELARLPGGAELNILAAGSNGTTTALPLYRTTAAAGGPQPGKLTFVNAITAAGNGTGLTLKGTDSAGSGRAAVHVVTPVQTGQLSSLTPVVVSRYDHHLHHQDAAGLFTTTTAAAVGPPPSSGKVGALVSRN